jgi:hypothetical protein
VAERVLNSVVGPVPSNLAMRLAHDLRSRSQAVEGLHAVETGETVTFFSDGGVGDVDHGALISTDGLKSRKRRTTF